MYAIRLDLFPVEISRKGRYLDKETPPKNINPCTSIVVSSTAAFSPSFPPGTALNRFFFVYQGNYLECDTLKDVLYGTSIYRADFFDHPLPDHIDLLLMHPPDTVSTHRFAIYMRLADGTVFRDTTKLIKLY